MKITKIKLVILPILFLFFDLSSRAQDLSTLFEKLDPSVVTIEAIEYKVKDQQITTTGGLESGVIVDNSGLIITATHVVETANEISVKLQNGTKFQADVLSSSTAADVALLKLRVVPPNLTSVTIGDSGTTKIGERIFVIGAPRGLEHSLSVGYVSRKMKRNMISNGEMAGFIQTDASIKPR